jgi:predicted nucleotidyltransferase
MLFGTNMESVLEPFLKEPLRGFQLRELSRKTKIGLPSVKNHVSALERRRFMVRKKGRQYDYYEANRESAELRIIKVAYTLTEIRPAVEVIAGALRPNAVVLFGSAAKGEDTEKSDIDLFIQARRKDFDFSRIERKMNRRISLTFEPDLGKLSHELLNNLANGITVYGFLEVAS